MVQLNVFYQSGFFHVPLDTLHLRSCCHNGCKCIVFHQYRFFHVLSDALHLRIHCHIGCNWMVFHHCGFFLVPLDALHLRICFHNGCNWMVLHQCGFFHVLTTSENWLSQWLQLNVFSSVWIILCSFRHTLSANSDAVPSHWQISDLY